MWIDEVELTICAGRGGDGVISFRHEKCVELGGPNGGDGGRGGNVIFRARHDAASLGPLRGRKVLKAENGANGETSGRTGKSGKDLLIEVPVGTVIRRSSDSSVIADLARDTETVIVAGAGRGGRGNQAYATATNRSPKYRELGEPGKKIKIKLEIRLMADVGLVGLPNAGKSTLLSRLSAAKPKIADYPFTTLEPLLGIVERSGVSFTMADLPGLIRGAHLGKGLGIRFLRHIERTRLILHLVDATSENPDEDFLIIRDELEAYGHGLAEKFLLVALTKADALADVARVAKDLSKASKNPNLAPFKPLVISAHSGRGLDELCYAIAERLAEIPAVEPLRSEIMLDEEEMPVIARKEGDVFLVEGDAVRRYLERRAPEDIHSWRRFWQTLVRWGVADELKRLGIRERDTVKIGDMELEYFDEDEKGKGQTRALGKGQR